MRWSLGFRENLQFLQVCIFWMAGSGFLEESAKIAGSSKASLFF
jgi:hypothetical protein